MSAPDHLTHDQLQAMLQRQERLQSRIERGLPIADADVRWMAHVCGRLLFAAVGEVLRAAREGDAAARRVARGVIGSGGRRRGGDSRRRSPLPRTPKFPN